MTEPTEAIFDRTKLEDSRPALYELLAALRRVDRLLKKAMVVARAAYGSKASADAYRGFYIDQETVERSLAREPGAPPFQVQGEGAEDLLPSFGDETSRLVWLARAFGLSDFELDLILIALAPELDLRYEQVYAYLQDDVTRKRPSLDLALNLLCSSAAEKLARRDRFSPNAPLIRQGLLHLIPAPDRVEPAELAYFLKLDNQILSLLLAREGLDQRLALFCQLVEPTAYLDELPLNPETKENLAALVVQAEEGQQPLKFYFYGPQGAGKRRTAEALASEVGMLLLAADLAQALRVKADFEQVLKPTFRTSKCSIEQEHKNEQSIVKKLGQST
ncbi:MAG: hypothetical protein QNJ53_29645 [Pleurocapsa sp. MO_192.B19]|nr:hypothetical protein [Pleurocapsa sp. MO_192.B19]